MGPLIFNSLLFLIFLVVVLLFFHGLPLPWRHRKLGMVVINALFFASFYPPYTLLLLFSTLLDFWVGAALHKSNSPVKRRLLLITSLGVNLGLLGAFKYADFFLDTLSQLAITLGIQLDLPPTGVLLPIGISFYTFQTLSYTLDIYRKRIEPADNFVDFGFFVSFFPQLVAGPIVRAHEFLPQLLKPPRVTPNMMAWGLMLLILGLFEKVVLADTVFAPVADQVFLSPEKATSLDAWLGAMAFSGQIFFDFSGYSTCAIGTALCFGFALPANFRFPYGAIGFSDFWHRWHITLSSWLRDYLYIPLGGSRHGLPRTLMALMLTMFLGGLWHGAAWTFVAWGLVHGGFLVVERLVKTVWTRVNAPVFWLTRACGGVITYGLVTMAWVLFRAQTFGDAQVLLARMMTFSGAETSLLKPVMAWFVSGCAVLMVTTHFLLRRTSLEAVANRLPAWALSGIVVLCIVALMMFRGEMSGFIYFQF